MDARQKVRGPVDLDAEVRVLPNNTVDDVVIISIDLRMQQRDSYMNTPVYILNFDKGYFKNRRRVHALCART